MLRFLRCSAANFGFYGVFMECSWGVQPVLRVFAFLETTPINIVEGSHVFGECNRVGTRPPNG